MKRIKDTNLVPPGGAFVYRHKISGAEFRHHTVPHLFEQVRKHCAANGYDFAPSEFTENVCSNAHPNVCEEVDDITGLPPLVERIATFAKAVVSHGRSGFRKSDDELYQERLAICTACPYFGGETGGTYFSIACRKCGCSGIKLKWAGTKCPDGLW